MDGRTDERKDSAMPKCNIFFQSECIKIIFVFFVFGVETTRFCLIYATFLWAFFHNVTCTQKPVKD